MATLINGDGNAAVYAAQDSDWFAGVEGNTTKILKVGAKMEYEIEDANTIAIKNGVLVTKEGRRVQIDAGAIDEFIIPTGTQGVTRYFIIGYHLYTDASSNQLCETFVQLMANGTDTIPEDTFRGGSTDVYVSLYRVKQDGITLDTIQSLLPEGVDLDGIGDEIDDIKDDIDQINSDLTELVTEVEVASVAATGRTYLTQFQAILETYNTLTAEQKRNAVLVHEGGRYVNDGAGTFYRVFSNVNGLYVYCFSSTHVRFISGNTGAVTAYNVSSNSAAMEMKLLTRG